MYHEGIKIAEYFPASLALRLPETRDPEKAGVSSWHSVHVNFREAVKTKEEMERTQKARGNNELIKGN